METFQTLLASKLSDALAKAGLPTAGELTLATDARFGDYQTNAALVLGKQRGENPKALAEKILAGTDVSDLCEPPTVAGAGFINFTLRSDAVAKKAGELLPDERLGVANAKSTKKIVIDFGSPNVAKPMHVGHIRSTVLGDALARIASFLGHEVIRDNHIGDWGTQFGMVIYGWKNLLDRQSLQRDPLAEIVRIYKETNEKATSDPQVREACRQELVKLQAGDKENIDIWNECVAFSMQDFDQVYRLLDIRFDIQCGESFYNDRLPAVVDRLLKSGIAEISEGAVCVFFRDIPQLADKPCIIRKRDRKIIEEKNPDLSEADKIDIAQKIGIGAVKYADLSQYRMTDYVFSWDRMLSLQGNTAPYLQNAYVRIRSIFRKAGEPAPKIDKLILRDPSEINLAKRLCQFAEIVPQVLNDFRPNILANYLFELANSFHTFYEACPVLKSDEPVRSSRLALCDLSGRVLQRGLDLLGIKVPEKM